ncbi:hypothetical protein [Rhizobium sp. BK418]|uniref:hypothetical protein n=1 Tax=Rhizobium sp. BK418 TaxID=2512120 RepID=UPI00140485C7|nr:hypothetical protein [Rhizobium sp. BK418]
MANEIATIPTMTHGSDQPFDAGSVHAPAVPFFALDRALAIVRRHGYGLANSTTPEGRAVAAAGLALAIAKSLSEIASRAPARDQPH